jgi:hypothetical protein
VPLLLKVIWRGKSVYLICETKIIVKQTNQFIKSNLAAIYTSIALFLLKHTSEENGKEWKVEEDETNI